MAMQVRALQGTGWQKSAEHFGAFAAVVGQLAEVQLAGVRRRDMAPRDLSSVRMLLRGTLKQVPASYCFLCHAMISQDCGQSLRQLQEAREEGKGLRSGGVMTLVLATCRHRSAMRGLLHMRLWRAICRMWRMRRKLLDTASDDDARIV